MGVKELRACNKIVHQPTSWVGELDTYWKADIVASSETRLDKLFQLEILAVSADVPSN